jgi:hypothetical protein
MLELIALTLAIAPSGQSSVDPVLAARYFQEVRWIAEDDNGSLWGIKLYGPMMFVDPRTLDAVTNQASPLLDFQETNGVFAGKFPPNLGAANTAYEIGGTRWTIVIWPPPENRAERATLLMHELFHLIQPDLGFQLSNPKNAHLETLEGRLWLQVELAALAKAAGALDAAEREAMAKDALFFRAVRQRKFPGSKAEEDALELNEGLAQYTGFMLRGGWEPESRMWLANQLRQQGGRESYTRDFAYWTGSAYGFLLNVVEAVKFEEIRWRKRLKSDSSLSGELAALLKPDLSLSDEQAIGRARPHGYDSILARETELDVQRKARVAAIRKRLIEGSILILPLERTNMTFRNDEIVSLGSAGTYYETATLNNEWGKLEVTAGVIVAGDFKTARVASPTSASEMRGPGWRIELKPGWRIVAGERKGDFLLKKE